MFTYTHPSREIEFLLKKVLDFDHLCAEFGLPDIDGSFFLEILAEAARFGREELDPLYQSGDKHGAKLESRTDGGTAVIESPGFAQAYARFSEGGWTSLSAPEQYGGQQLPYTLAVAVSEVFQSCNLAFALCPMLSQGAIEALEAHGNSTLKESWLPGLVSGRYTGTMNLTEPQAGSDLAAIRTSARKDGEHYLIRGQKIFISWGDHQMAENILHLVLARLDDAPQGVKGISLFLVPKYLQDADGNKVANDLSCISIEHKMGLHGSPTCTMQFGEKAGAIGYLIGEENAGLSCMFTMMNNARQAVGIQGLAGAERATQMATQYAAERVQGTNPDGTRFVIANYPDVQRMLLTMQSLCEVMRGVAYYGASCLDRANYTNDLAARARGELFTPIIKGWITELAQEICATAMQVYGGMGYIEETGIAQIYRDVRVFGIYEGTTAIQANDLLQRKLLRDNGKEVDSLLDDIVSVADDMQRVAGLDLYALQLRQATEEMRSISSDMVRGSTSNKEAVQSSSVPYLMAMGYLCGAWQAGVFSLHAKKLYSLESEKEFAEEKLKKCRFYFRHILPRGTALQKTIRFELSEVKEAG